MTMLPLLPFSIFFNTLPDPENFKRALNIRVGTGKKTILTIHNSINHNHHPHQGEREKARRRRNTAS